jgi:hypothetical protein
VIIPGPGLLSDKRILFKIQEIALLPKATSTALNKAAIRGNLAVGVGGNSCQEIKNQCVTQAVNTGSIPYIQAIMNKYRNKDRLLW